MKLENEDLKAELEAAQGLVQVQNKLHAAQVAGAADTAAADLDAAVKAAGKAAREASKAAKEAKAAHITELKRREETAAQREAELVNKHLQSKKELQQQRNEAQAAQREAEQRVRRAFASATATKLEAEEHACKEIAAATAKQQEVEEQLRKELAAVAAAQLDAEDRARGATSAAATAQSAAESVAHAREADADRNCEELKVQLLAAEFQVHSLRTSNGMKAAELERLRFAEAARRSAASDTTLRNQQRREAKLRAELSLARAEVDQLRVQKQAKSQEALPEKRQCAGRQPMPTIPEDSQAAAQPQRPKLRTSNSENAPLLPRTCELLRSLVEETNGSFEGAASACALVYQLYIGHPPPPHLTFCSNTIKNAFIRLGRTDRSIEAAITRAEMAPWAIAADGGNKGNRAMNMVAMSTWCWALRKPQAEAMACGDLFRDQSAKNAAEVCRRAAERAGKDPALCFAACSDGADAATLEMAALLEQQHEASGNAAQLSIRETCAIHGKALEENAGLDAAAASLGYVNEFLVDALRLAWEIFSGPDSRPTEYIQIWSTDCGLPHDQFNILSSMAEPTASKWQVLYEICIKLLPLLEPYSDEGDPTDGWSTSMLEHFLTKLRKLCQVLSMYVCVCVFVCVCVCMCTMYWY